MPYRVRSTDVWFNLPGVVAAYQPVACPGGPLLARVNVSNEARTPGRYAAVAGVAPTFDPRYGWSMNGSSQYLTTGVVAASGYSMLLRYSDAVANDVYLAGSRGTNAEFFLYPRALANTLRWFYGNGNKTSSPNQSTGVMGLAGSTGYHNGVAKVTSIGTFSGAGVEMYVGALNNAGSPSFAGSSKQQAMLIAPRTLSAAEVLLASQQMAWCHLNPDWNAWGRRRRYYYAPIETPPVTTDDLKAAAATIGMFGTPALGRPAMTGHQQAAANAVAVKVGHRSRLNG